MQFESIAAVLFDLDGTLLEHAFTWEEICRATYDEFADRIDPAKQDQFWAAYSAKAGELWAMMLDGSLPQHGARTTGLLHALREINADEGLAAPMLLSRDRKLLEGGALATDAIPVLRRLRSAGLKIGIVTNGYISTQQMKIDHYGLDSYVDFTVISQAVGFHKPDKAIFDVALSLAEAAPECAVFVGDTVETDIHGALNAGLHPVLIDQTRTHDGLVSYGGQEVTITCIRRLRQLLPELRMEEM
ncbi:MAG: HAD family hydrolase [Candidatus Hydrogenedentes bacterium]|nr:HAD family hydrolase [Candidatus Hydrogenedentota bacterium]